MPLKCENCGASVTLTDNERRKLSGKFFACPECGTSKRIPEANGSSRRMTPLLVTVAAIVVVVIGVLWREVAGTGLPVEAQPAVAAPAAAQAVEEDKMATSEPLASDERELMMTRRDPHDLVRLSIMRRFPGGGFEMVKWWPPREVKTTDSGIVRACRMTYRVSSKSQQAKGDVIAIVRNEIIHENWDFGPHPGRHDGRPPNKTAEEILAAFDNEKN